MAEHGTQEATALAAEIAAAAEVTEIVSAYDMNGEMFAAHGNDDDPDTMPYH